jgi:hypothetical protein
VRLALLEMMISSMTRYSTFCFTEHDPEINPPTQIRRSVTDRGQYASARATARTTEHSLHEGDYCGRYGQKSWCTDRKAELRQ